MALNKSLYRGKRELTMAQFEALSSIDENTDYNIMDYPDNGMTNAQLLEVLNYTRLFADGYITICIDDGTFGKGHILQIQNRDSVRQWVDLTATLSGGSLVFDSNGIPLSEVHITEDVNAEDTENTKYILSPKAVSTELNKIKEELGGGLPTVDLYW